MKTTFFFLTWLILLAIIKRLIPDWFNDTKPEEEKKAIKPINSAVTVTAEKDVVVIKPKKASSSPSIESKPQKYYYSDDQTSSQTKKEKPKRKIIQEDIPDDFYALSRLTISPVFSVVNLKNPANSILEFSVKGFNIYGKEISVGEIIWETSGGKIDKNGRLLIDREAQGFYQVTATSKDSIKHTKFIRNTLLTVGVSTRILKWSIANERFFYDVLSQLFDFSFDFDGDGEISIDELMIGDWMIDFGRKYILDFLTKTSNFCINEYLKTISATTFYLIIPAPSNQPISSIPIYSELPPESSKIIKPEKNVPVLKDNNINIIKISQFLSKYKPIESTGVKLQFTKNFIEVGVQTSDFFISEKFSLQEGQSEINGLVEVNAVHFIEIVSALSKQGQEITFELKDKLLYLTPDTFISVERVVEAKPPKVKNILVIPDQTLLRWFADLSLVAQKGGLPPNPYIDGTLSRNGLTLLVANPLMSVSHLYRIGQLNDWDSTLSVAETTCARIFLPAKAIMELPSNEKLEIHVGGRHLMLKAGSVTVKIERFKDPLTLYISNNFHEKRGKLSFTLTEPDSSTAPSRMEKLINWQNQTKAKACDLIAGPNGIWVKPTTKVKNLDFLETKEIPANTLQLFDMPCGNTNRIASIPRVVIETIEKLGIKKDVKIGFPEKEGDVLYIESGGNDLSHSYSEISVKAQFVEIPIAEVVAMPVAELADSKPLVIEKGGETLMEVAPTVAEAIQTAIAEDSIPEAMKESVTAAVEKAETLMEKAETMSNETLAVLDDIKKGKKSATQKANGQNNAFAENGQEAANAVVSTQSAEVADAQKAIAETAIVEAIDIDSNVIQLDTNTKKKAKAIKEKVEATKAELESELKSESINMNRIIVLTLRLDTVGGRFIEIVFSLQTNWIPVLNIDEKFKEDAAKTYPNLV
jgi:hypothetical protein